jgi:hypothetical protein
VPRSLPGPIKSQASSSPAGVGLEMENAMAKASISIGVDDATGQPDSAPQGPYITDRDDGSRPRSNRPSPPVAPREPTRMIRSRETPMAVMRTYTGGCHCGEVRYETTVDLATVMACNCSLCTKRGILWAFVQPEHFALRSGEEDLTDYQFNKKVIHHLFCSTCGVESFARGKMPDGSDVVAINVRCLDGIDIAALEVKPFDGRSL